MKKIGKNIIGIDEVGRGALAGPVVVAVALVDRCTLPIINPRLGKLKDSKQLSAKQREAWYAYFLAHPRISFAVACVHPRQIEKLNISIAGNTAALRAFLRLAPGGPRLALCATPVFLDGGLYLANRKNQALHWPNARTVPKADEKIPAVAIASIIAKVHRDRLMRRLAKQYPGYGFEIHKGYGTKNHYAALEKLGPSRVHRLTFVGKRPTIRK